MSRTAAAGAMAEARLDPGIELAERTMILDDLEERIVAEAARPAGGEENAAATRGMALGHDRARRIGQADVADELGPAPLPRQPGQLGQQFLVVPLVGGPGV